MSVFYGVRIPDGLSEKIVATGQGKTEVITAALRMYFGAVAVQPKAEKIKPAREKKAELDPLAVALELAASGVVEPEQPKPAPKAEPIKKVCAWCGGRLAIWGSGQRCEVCKRNQ